MPFQISATFNLADTIAALQGQQRHLPFAIRRAVNETANRVKEAEIKEMRDVFDRPTPWTLNGVAIVYAPKEAPTVQASVFLKNERAGSTIGAPADVYLTPQISGGTRNLKRFERAFRAAGVLPSSHFMVPGSGIQLDRYGNIGVGDIIKLLSYFQAFPEQGYRANITPEGKRQLKKGTKTRPGTTYFVAPVGGRMMPGIYQRFTGSRRILPLIMFVDSVHYTPIYDFNGVAELTVAKEFPNELATAIRTALETAR